MSPTSNRIATPLLIIFGLVNLPLSMLLSPTAAMLPNFYLEYSAVTLAGLASATLVARLFDGITDPLIGLLSDRAGNRKPWMVAGALLVSASAWFLYNPAADAGLGHLLVWYLLVTLGWTLVEIPHTAMAAELSGDYHERSRIALYRQLLGFVGGILFMASPMLLIGGTTAFTPEVFRVISLFIMIALPVTVVGMCRCVPEPRRGLRTRSIRPADLWLALKNTPPLQYFLVTQILFGLATGAVMSLFVIYSSQYLGLAEKIPHIAMPMTLAMALGMPLWLQVMKRVDKHRAWAVAAVGMIGQELEKNRIRFVSGSAHFPRTGRAITMGVEHGMWRLYADAATGEILGSVILGPNADDLIHIISTMMHYHGTVRDILDRMPWYHPTLSEVIMNLAREIVPRLDPAP